MRLVIYSIVVILLTLGGCHPNDPALRTISHADSVLDSLPDSALNLLRTLNDGDLKTREARARYSLTYTMALLKTGHEPHGDSLLRPAIDYFGNDDTPSRETMLMHFAKAALSDSAMQKIEEYDKTIELATGKNARVYHALALFNKGNVYGRAYSSPDELECIRHGLKAIHGTTDTCSIIYGHLVYGMALNANDQSEEALSELSSALDLSTKSGVGTYVPLLSREIGYTHSLLGHHQEAMAAFDSMQPAGNVEFTPADLYALARSAAAMGRFQLADQIMETLPGDDSPEEKCNFYFTRAGIMAAKGDYREAYNLLDSSYHCNDVIVMAKLDANLSRQEKEKAMLTAAHHEQLAAQRRWQLLLTAGCSVTAVALLVASIYILRLRHRREILEEEVRRESQRRSAEATLESLKTTLQVLESQKSSLEERGRRLGDNIRTLKTEIASKEKERRAVEEEAAAYAETVASLKSELKVSDATIALIREQLRENFIMTHRSNATFCNELPGGMSSPEAIKVYESQRDLILRQYSEPERVEALGAQIANLFDNKLSELTALANLSETDVKTVIYELCGFNYKAMAVLLNSSSGAVATRRSRIKEKLNPISHALPIYFTQYLNF